MSDFHRASPSNVDVDSAGIVAFIDEIERDSRGGAAALDQFCKLDPSLPRTASPQAPAGATGLAVRGWGVRGLQFGLGCQGPGTPSTLPRLSRLAP